MVQLYLFSVIMAVGTIVSVSSSPHAKRQDANPIIDQATFDDLTAKMELAGASYCDLSNGWDCPYCVNSPTMTLTHKFTTSQTDTVGYVGVNNATSEIVVAFRGSVTDINWFEDFKVDKDPYAGLIGTCTDCEVHTGFQTSWHEAASDVLPQVWTQAAAFPNYTVVVVGHSLGGAVAALCAYDIASAGNVTVHLYTYGEPRVGNDKWAAAFDSIFGVQNNQPSRAKRVTHDNDPVPLLPYESFGYQHHGTQYWDSSPGNDTSSPNTIQICTGDEDSNCFLSTGTVTPFNLGKRRPIHSWYMNHKVNDCAYPA